MASSWILTSSNHHSSSNSNHVCTRGCVDKKWGQFTVHRSGRGMTTFTTCFRRPWAKQEVYRVAATSMTITKRTYSAIQYHRHPRQALSTITIQSSTIPVEDLPVSLPTLITSLRGRFLGHWVIQRCPEVDRPWSMIWGLLQVIMDTSEWIHSSAYVNDGVKLTVSIILAHQWDHPREEEVLSLTYSHHNHRQRLQTIGATLSRDPSLLSIELPPLARCPIDRQEIIPRPDYCRPIISTGRTRKCPNWILRPLPVLQWWVRVASA